MKKLFLENKIELGRTGGGQDGFMGGGSYNKMGGGSNNDFEGLSRTGGTTTVLSAPRLTLGGGEGN